MHDERARRNHPGELRWPAAVGVLVAIALYGALPSALQIGPRFVIPVLELLLFIPLVAANPRRMTRQNWFLRRLSIGLAVLIALSNTTALALLIRSLVLGKATAGSQLLVAAGQVWLTNVLVFALTFWELDRGGPVVRFRVSRPELPDADFRLPQDEDDDAVSEVANRSSAKSGWTLARRSRAARWWLDEGEQFVGVEAGDRVGVVLVGVGIAERQQHRGGVSG